MFLIAHADVIEGKDGKDILSLIAHEGVIAEIAHVQCAVGNGAASTGMLKCFGEPQKVEASWPWGLRTLHHALFDQLSLASVLVGAELV